MKDLSRRSFLASTSLAGIAVASNALALPKTEAQPKHWDLEADVVVIGSGATGMPAAIGARDAGFSVLVVDTNYDIGGHAICSGGNVPLGGGTALQRKYGIKDDPDTLFHDLVDWSVVETSGMPDYRYNDRDVQYVMAHSQAQTFDFLVANGVPFIDKAPDNFGAHATGLSAYREHHCIWDKEASLESPAAAGGTDLMRSLEQSARKKGVKFLLNYHMDSLFREDAQTYGKGGRVIGIKAHYTPTILPGEKAPLKSFRSEGNIQLSHPTITIRAKKAVVIATGGSSGNVEFRRIYDPRLTAEYPCAAAEFSPQDASGELAGIAIGASLWGTANQAMDRNGSLRKRNRIGIRTNYIGWNPNSPIFPKIKYEGLFLRSWQDAILVNQTGRRFFNELENGYPNGTAKDFYKDGKPYVQGDWRNTTRAKFRPRNYVDAALAINEGSVPPNFASGPQWAIFDAAAAEREHMHIAPGVSDPNLFFEANTLEELADKINSCSYQHFKMKGEVLAASVKRYNELVKQGEDVDFGKPKPQFEITKPPFYAAWATFAVHDTYAGLRINGHCQVLDWAGKVIGGLWCGGESAGGCSQHGLGRCLTQGYIIGQQIAKEAK